MNTKDKKLGTKIPKDAYQPSGGMDLDNSYSQTVNELGLQQSKRDQILAFYMTILGFVIPNVVDMNVGNFEKSAAFFCMYIIGVIFCHVILRYRIYKEVYWIACRVLTQLCNVCVEKRNKEIIYILFFNCLKKNMGTIVVKGRFSLLKSFKRQLNSAETLLYETLVLFASFVGCVGSFYLLPVSKTAAVASWVFIGCMFISMNYKYTKRLMDLYKCVDTGNEKDLDKTFAKAWMLHCYVDDILND